MGKNKGKRPSQKQRKQSQVASAEQQEETHNQTSSSATKEKPADEETAILKRQPDVTTKKSPSVTEKETAASEKDTPATEKETAAPEKPKAAVNKEAVAEPEIPITLTIQQAESGAQEGFKGDIVKGMSTDIQKLMADNGVNINLLPGAGMKSVSMVKNVSVQKSQTMMSSTKTTSTRKQGTSSSFKQTIDSSHSSSFSSHQYSATSATAQHSIKSMNSVSAEETSRESLSDSSELDSPSMRMVSAACQQFPSSPDSSAQVAAFSQYSAQSKTVNSSFYKEVKEQSFKESFSSNSSDRPKALGNLLKVQDDPKSPQDQVTKTPTKRKVSTDQSTVMNILKSQKFGGYEIPTVIYEATVEGGEQHLKMFKELVKKKDTLKHLNLDELDHGVVQSPVSPRSPASPRPVITTPPSSDEMAVTSPASIEVAIAIKEDFSDIPLESPIQDEKRAFTFEKSRSVGYQLERRMSRQQIIKENRVSISGEDIINDDESNSLIAEFKASIDDDTDDILAEFREEVEEKKELENVEELGKKNGLGDIEEKLRIEKTNIREIPFSLPRSATQLDSDKGEQDVEDPKRNMTTYIHVNVDHLSMPRNANLLSSSSSSSSFESKEDSLRSKLVEKKVKRTTINQSKFNKTSQEKISFSEILGDLYEMYSYPVKIMSSDGNTLKKIRHYLDVGSCSKEEKSSLKVAFIAEFKMVAIVDVESLDENHVFFNRDSSQQETAVVVSCTTGLPLGCTLVPVCTSSSFFLAVLVGSVHNLNRLLVGGLRKCGYDQKCVLRRGQHNMVNILNQTNSENVGEIKFGSNSESCLVELIGFVPQDFLDIHIHHNEKAIFRSTLSLYNIGRVKVELPVYERKPQLWEVIKYDGVSVDNPGAGRTSNLEPLFSTARQNKLTHDQLKSILLHLDVHEDFEDLEVVDALRMCINTWKKEKEARASIDKLIKVLTLTDVALNHVAFEILQNIANTSTGIHYAA